MVVSAGVASDDVAVHCDATAARRRGARANRRGGEARRVRAKRWGAHVEEVRLGGVGDAVARAQQPLMERHVDGVGVAALEDGVVALVEAAVKARLVIDVRPSRRWHTESGAATY